jgi:peptidyl-prolyl cis-trans isomerase C
VGERWWGDTNPTDEEIQKFYEKNKKAQFTTPEQVCVSHILFAKDQKEKAEEVKKQLQDGGDFAKLAKQYSQDPGSAEKGGDLGCLGKGETVPPFEEAAFGADEGEIVGPVKTQFGYHLLEVTEKKPQQIRSLSEVEPQIRSQLSSEKQSEAFSKWLDEQKKKRNVQYLEGYKPA